MHNAILTQYRVIWIFTQVTKWR